MVEGHTKEEILSILNSVPVAAVATSAGEAMRNRMMHFAADEDFNIYLATMKGDPKTIQMTHHPSLSLLIHKGEDNINDSREVEVTGTVTFLRGREEREKALQRTAQRSPVVKYLVETGNAEVLDCLKVVPDTVKFRIFGEIVQGMPPTVLEFPENRQRGGDWHLAKMKFKNWLMELRAPFLTATLVPLLLGTTIAWMETGTLLWGYFLLAFLAALLLHAGTNVMNDYSDHRSGNDRVNQEFVRPFSGGSRAIQLGLLTPLEVLLGSLFLYLAGIGIGLYLAWARGPVLLALGAVALLSGIFYTGRPLNWASRGVGEALVGLNFGVLMTLGAYYVQTQTLSWVPAVAGIPVALLIAAVLYINEFPDFAADRAVGKKTLVVRLGREKAVTLYAAMMGAVYLSILIAVATGVLPWAALIALATLPLAVRAIQYAARHHSSSFDLVPANALTIIIHLGTGLLLTLAYVWESLGLGGLGYVIGLGVAFVAFTLFMYQGMEKQKNIFLGLKQAMKRS